MQRALARRRLGRTKLEVSELGLGTAPLGNLYQPISDEQARSTVAAAIAAGMCYVDTAPSYGFGLSERRLGDVLRSERNVIVSTKVGKLLRPRSDVIDDREREAFRSPMPFECAFDYSFDGIMRSWEASLQRLGLARVDLLYVHDIDRTTHGAAHSQRLEQLLKGGGCKALAQLRAEGAIAGVGIGVNEVAICLELMVEFDFDVILLAGRYTLLEQQPLDTLFPQCAQRQIALIIGGPFNSGILATGTRGALPPHFNYGSASAAIVERVRRIEQVCERYRVPLAAAALQFPLAHPLVASVIPGLESAQLVARGMQLYSQPIPAELWAQLKREGLMHADAPTPAVTAAAAH